MKDYKVEMKPTFWMVDLTHGRYSDIEQQYVCFRANDENEVWNNLCRYLEDIFDKDDWSAKGVIIWNGQNYVVKKFLEHRRQISGYEDWEPDFNTGYGDAWEVHINRLHVIDFNS